MKLIKQHFKLDHLDYAWMSPVIIPPGYTRDYIDGLVSKNEQMESIHTGNQPETPHPFPPAQIM